jgi:hypothetical protein
MKNDICDFFLGCRNVVYKRLLVKYIPSIREQLPQPKRVPSVGAYFCGQKYILLMLEDKHRNPSD